MKYKQNPIATVFGADNFIGSAIVKKLIANGYKVRAAVQRKNCAYFLSPLSEPDNIEEFEFQPNNKNSIRAAIENASVVINVIGISPIRKKRDIVLLNAELPQTIAKECRTAGVESLIHLSCINEPYPKSSIAETKAWGDSGVASEFANANIIRTSAVFGDKDDFVSNLTKFPFLPAKTGVKLQPIYVQDLAEACIKVIDEKSKIYYLGGGEVFTVREIVDKISKITGKKITKFCLMSKIFPIVFKEFKQDSVVPENTIGLSELGIIPMPFGEIIPRYIGGHAKAVF